MHARNMLLGLAALFLFHHPVMAQDKPAYRLFDSQGKALSYRKALKRLASADVVCFGELHNNPIAHWLELELLLDLRAARPATPFAVGAEMFEADQQGPLDAYLAGTLDRLGDTLQLWPNYDTDYAPVVDACKAAGIPVIATNVPRRYARQVSLQGVSALDSLGPDERAWVVPLPFPIDDALPSYAAMRDMFSGHGGQMNPDYFIAAQALKDATMAHFILQYLPAGGCFYHLNGAYHSDSQEGIIWYLRQQRPDLRIANLSVVEQDDIAAPGPEHRGKADVLIVVPARMTKTYLSTF
ncbi:MAG: hypothetical protein OHK0039_14290 [Bacteroidia bacterium]